MNLSERKAEIMKKLSITKVSNGNTKRNIETKLLTFQKKVDVYATKLLKEEGLHITALEVIPEIKDRKPTGNALDVKQHSGVVLAEKVTLKDATTGKTRTGYILGINCSTYWNPKRSIVTELFPVELDDEKQNASNRVKFKEVTEAEPMATIECDFRTIA